MDIKLDKVPEWRKKGRTKSRKIGEGIVILAILFFFLTTLLFYQYSDVKIEDTDNLIDWYILSFKDIKSSIANLLVAVVAIAFLALIAEEAYRRELRKKNMPYPRDDEYLKGGDKREN